MDIRSIGPRLVSNEVTSPRQSQFEAGFQLIQDSYPADEVDPKCVFADQVRMQHGGKFGKDAYHFVVLQDPIGRVAGAVTFNYLSKSSVAFENYGVTSKKDDPEGHRALVDAMERRSSADATRAGKKLFGIVVEADKSEIDSRHANGYGLLEGVDYIQPPLGPGMRPVPLPLMVKVSDSNDPSVVKEGSRIVGIKADRVREIVADIYESVYEKDLTSHHGVPTTQYAAKLLHSLEGKDVVTFS